jgi:hypothetical protein
VFVEKNLNAPVFSNNNADIERVISESTAVGTEIVKLNASDADLYVSQLIILPI